MALIVLATVGRLDLKVENKQVGKEDLKNIETGRKQNEVSS